MPPTTRRSIDFQGDAITRVRTCIPNAAIFEKPILSFDAHSLPSMIGCLSSLRSSLWEERSSPGSAKPSRHLNLRRRIHRKAQDLEGFFLGFNERLLIQSCQCQHVSPMGAIGKDSFSATSISPANCLWERWPRRWRHLRLDRPIEKARWWRGSPQP